MKNESVYIVILLFLAILPIGIFADGNATLGTPSISIASGTGIIANGTGLVSQPGFINIEVPSGVTVEQVLLYWAGRGTPDDTIVVNGTEVTGTKIGEELPSSETTAYRYDITGLGLVSAGMVNTLEINDSLFIGRPDGASVVVIIDDGVSSSNITIKDGMDWAWVDGSTLEFRTTVPQTFNFPAAGVDRTGNLILIMGDGTAPRADKIEITVDGTTTVITDEAKGRDGAEWDTIPFDVFIPAGDDSVTVQLFSEGNNPDSLSWVAAALSVPDPQPPSSCDDGKPRVLVFKYTGDGCGATTNNQSGKVVCTDENPYVAGPVQVIAIASNKAPTVVVNGNMVTVTADGKKLASQIDLEIRQGSTLLQSLSIHTSCSKPLNVEDQFGSLLLTQFIPKD
jgi:hypothetical protein